MLRRLLSSSLSVFIFLCLFVAAQRQAWGYVDPGSGLLALQSAGAVLATFGYFLRRRIRSLFDRSAAEKKPVLPVSGKEGDAAKVA